MNLADDLVTVVGIMPPGFDFPSPAVDLWVPMANRLRGRSRSAHYLDVIGRLGPAATLAGATDVLRTIAARLERAYPATNRGWGVTVVPLHESVTGDVRLPLLVLLGTGRAFENRDDARGAPVAVVDHTFVQRYLPGEPAVGRRVQMTNEKTPRQIVGVVGAVRQTRLEDAADPHVYIPHAQNPSPVMTFVVRTSGDPAALVLPVRERLKTMDASRPVYNVGTAADHVAGTVAPRRFTVLLVALFALLAGVQTVRWNVWIDGGMGRGFQEGIRRPAGPRRRATRRRQARRPARGLDHGRRHCRRLPVALASTRIVETMLLASAGGMHQPFPPVRSCWRLEWPARSCQRGALLQ